MIGGRSLALAAVGSVLALAGLAAGYVRLELAEPEPFADRAVDALRSERVQAVIAEQVAVEMLERGSPDLVASRPVVLTAVQAVLGTQEFTRVMRQAAITAHEVLLQGDEDVVIELEEASAVLLPVIEDVAPEAAEQIPRDLNPRVAAIRRTDAATWVLRVAEGSGLAAIPLLLAALAAFAGSIALAPDRRLGTAAAGLIAAAGGGLGLAAMAGLRAQVIAHAGEVGVLSEDDAQAAAGATWDALAGGLEQWLVILAAGGVLVAAGALLADARVDREAALRHALVLVAGAGQPRALRLLRGLALAAVGALVLLRAEPVFRTAVAVLGGALVLLGLAEAVSTWSSRPRRAPGRWTRQRSLAVAGGGAAAVAAAVVAAVLVTGGGGAPAPPDEREITECNGLAQLCDRRLDEVVFPGTHNSMAAADRPGWFFANQIRPIPLQLQDGIRLLMIDPHYGVVDARGRVRTDLEAEGTSRNRVARQLGTDAVHAAERLAGRLGLVPSEGEREIFLCHTLCELGAERMSSALGEMRGFLERNRAEVLVVFLESSVDPAAVEEEFDEADLGPYLVTLERGEPMPTLRELIASGRRLVVFDERDGGPGSWHHAGFLHVQDTRISTLLESETACDPNRGAPESPLFLMNHWIDRFPPPLSENRDVSDRETLLRRIRACRERRDRSPNLIGVDFYEHGDVISVARELNLRAR